MKPCAGPPPGPAFENAPAVDETPAVAAPAAAPATGAATVQSTLADFDDTKQAALKRGYEQHLGLEPGAVVITEITEARRRLQDTAEQPEAARQRRRLSGGVSVAYEVTASEEIGTKFDDPALAQTVAAETGVEVAIPPPEGLVQRLQIRR